MFFILYGSRIRRLERGEDIEKKRRGVDSEGEKKEREEGKEARFEGSSRGDQRSMVI